MRREPGVLCIVIGCIHATEDNGRLVELVEFVPPGVAWRTPDASGWLFATSDMRSWAVKSAGTPFVHRIGSSLVMHSEYAVFSERVLRPIPGGEGRDETLAWKPVPLPQIEGQPA